MLGVVSVGTSLNRIDSNRSPCRREGNHALRERLHAGRHRRGVAHRHRAAEPVRPQIFGAWIYDFVLAFLFGIAFQHFTIKPMRDLSVKDGIKQALRADSLSLVAWQVGMYGWMAIATFAIFHRELLKTNPVFWFMMQLAMFVGFATSFPLNRWLLHRGIKEKM